MFVRRIISASIKVHEWYAIEECAATMITCKTKAGNKNIFITINNLSPKSLPPKDIF